MGFASRPYSVRSLFSCIKCTPYLDVRMRLFRSGQAAISMITTILLYPYPLIASHSDGLSPYSNGYAPDVVHLRSQGHGLHESRGTDLDPNEFDNLTVTVDRRAAKDFYLRVMPLGASITQGYKSSDGNGYRKWLRAQLRFRGWKVNMVGSERDGTMADSVSYSCKSHSLMACLMLARTTKVILAGPLSPFTALGQKASG
jgi:hypothetical protein